MKAVVFLIWVVVPVVAVAWVWCNFDGSKPVVFQAQSGTSIASLPDSRAIERLSAKYKLLAAHYWAMGDEMYTSSGDALRLRVSRLGETIRQEQLPIGVSRQRVFEVLGPPSIDLQGYDSVLYYLGDERSCFHCYSFDDQLKLLTHSHNFIFDIEGGR